LGLWRNAHPDTRAKIVLGGVFLAVIGTGTVWHYATIDNSPYGRCSREAKSDFRDQQDRLAETGQNARPWSYSDQEDEYVYAVCGSKYP
jgi:hypothetical protein